MQELRFKQHTEDFSRINAYQIETGLITKKDGTKVQLFCLKDRVFNAVISKAKWNAPVTTEKVADKTNTNAMDIESTRILKLCWMM